MIRTLRILALALLIGGHLLGWHTGRSAGSAMCLKASLFYLLLRVRIARMERRKASP